jgi:hypothetical protein
MAAAPNFIRGCANARDVVRLEQSRALVRSDPLTRERLVEDFLNVVHVPSLLSCRAILNVTGVKVWT